LIPFFKRILARLTPASYLGFCYDILGLIAVLRGDLPVSSDYLGRGQDLLSVAGIVRCDLSRFRPREPAARYRLDDLLPPWTGGIKVFLQIAFDLRSPASPWLDLVAESAELVGEVGLIHSGSELLGFKETAWL